MRIATLLCIVSLSTLWSCKKENQPSESLSLQPNVQILNGHVAFASTADYDRYLELTEENKQEVVRTLQADASFKPYSKSRVALNSLPIGNCEVPDDVVEDNPVLFDVLDRNGIVQIGPDLWRLDYCNNKVFLIYATDAEDPNNYNDFLLGNFANPTVGVFPTSVDALDAVAEGYRTMPDDLTLEGNEIFAGWNIFGSWRHENKYFNDVYVANSTVAGWDNAGNDNTRMNGKLAYDKFALYFHFYGKEKYQRTAIWGLWQTAKIDNPDQSSRHWRVEFTYSYWRKGSGQTLQNGSGTLLPGTNVRGAENKTDKTFYDGRRGLKSNYGYARWDVWNDLTNKVRVSRNNGNNEQPIFTTVSNQARAIPNYDLTSPNTSRYFISF